MSDSEGPSTPKKKRERRGELLKAEKSWRRQPFVDAWLEDTKFKGWLGKTSDPYKARCTCCKKELQAGKSELIKHSQTPSHQNNALQIKNVPKINTMFVRKPVDDKVKIKTAELKIIFDIIEHDRSFNSMNHVAQLHQSAMPDSTIASGVKLKRTKIKRLITNVIGKAVEEKKLASLKGKLFSLLIDESTDLGNDKNLCIVTKSITDDGLSCSTLLLDYVKIKDATAENLFCVFKHCLSKYGLSIKNVVGYCSDNANVMIGEHNSFVSRLLHENNEVVVLGCICHSLNLVASAASECLPKNVESLLHLIYSYFSRSPKRQSVLDELQSFMRVSHQKMINPSKTRWLALGNCVSRVLNQWPVLFALFAQAKIEDRNSVADLIFSELNNPFNKAYLQFLNYILPTFNSFNMLFQSEKIIIPSFANEAERFLRILASNFLTSENTKGNAIYKCNPKHPSNLLPLKDIKIGAAAEETLKGIQNSSDNDVSKYIETFKIRCLQFYQAAFSESVNRLPPQQGIMRSLAFLEPTVALGVNKTIQKSNISLGPLTQKFKTKINSELVENEWCLLSSFFSTEEKAAYLNLPVLEFWKQIDECQNFNCEYLFRNLAKLAKICLSFPHSNATVERIFSMVSDIKTKKRNRLSSETLSALVRVKLDMKDMKKMCYDYPVSDEMLKLFEENVYKKNTKDDKIAELLVADVDEDSD